jgi:hypothetical protein
MSGYWPVIVFVALIGPVVLTSVIGNCSRLFPRTGGPLENRPVALIGIEKQVCFEENIPDNRCPAFRSFAAGLVNLAALQSALRYSPASIGLQSAVRWRQARNLDRGFLRIDILPAGCHTGSGRFPAAKSQAPMDFLYARASLSGHNQCQSRCEQVDNLKYRIWSVPLEKLVKSVVQSYLQTPAINYKRVICSAGQLS